MPRTYDPTTKLVHEEDGSTRPVTDTELYMMCTSLKAHLIENGTAADDAQTIVSAFFSVEPDWIPDGVQTD